MHSEIGKQLNLDILAFHGWGFNSSFWKDWKKLLPKRVRFDAADRGYFFREKYPEFLGDSSHKVLFLHSFGLHWCPQNLLEEATCIVIFNSFKNFHAGDDKRSKQILKSMLSEFEQHPKKVLEKFWQNAFYPNKEKNLPGFKFDKQLLLNDLKKLDTSEIDTDQLINGKPIISLDGGNDRIVTTNQGKSFTELTEGNAVYHFIKEAGHALPSTHSKDCWSFISAMIPIFQNNGNYRRKRSR